VVIITDNHVGKLYAETVKLSFEAAGFEVAVFAFLEVKHLKT
jgi:3-dehydroquinate synthase